MIYTDDWDQVLIIIVFTFLIVRVINFIIVDESRSVEQLFNLMGFFCVDFFLNVVIPFN